MIEDLRQNVNTEIEILREISGHIRKTNKANPSEKKLIDTSIDSLRSSAKLINNSIPKLLDEISIAQQLPRKEISNKQLERVEFKRLDSRIHVTLKVDDRDKFLRDLSINEELIRRYRKSQDILRTKEDEVKSARLFFKLGNKYFLSHALNVINKGHFRSLYGKLRKANIEVLLSSYVAGIFFATALSIFASILLMIFFTFFALSPAPPFLSLHEGDFLIRFLKLIWIPLLLPLATFGMFYYFPSSEKESLENKIEQELPFAVIHMSAISSSGIEPTEIFKIIRASNEYPYLKREIRKVLNQINIYGYDLVTALNNVSKSTPSVHLSELLSGLSVTITSGGDLSTFLEKRAETLLVAYRLDREKYTRAAETFMDIYISVVIAAPMILMVLMVMMQVSNFGPSLSATTIAMIVGIINVVFLIALDLKQPTY